MEREPKTIPEGFRYVSFVAEIPGSDVNVNALIPDLVHYPSEAVRLSRKALRGSSYTKPEEHELTGLMVKWKQKVWTNPLVPGAQYYLREMHNADAEPGHSLVQVQYMTTFPMQEAASGPSLGIDIMVYDPADDQLLHNRLTDVPADIDMRHLEEGFIFDSEFGLLEEVGDKQRAFFYQGLLVGAGEKGPKV